ncbi:hypothetical protein TNCT_286821, partial [Trichonephila clavata]
SAALVHHDSRLVISPVGDRKLISELEALMIVEQLPQVVFCVNNHVNG